MFRQVASVHCEHYIGEKNCTARFATGDIREIPDKKLNQVPVRTAKDNSSAFYDRTDDLNGRRMETG